MHKKISPRLKRHRRIRVKMQGTAQRPRLVIYRSLNNLYGQLVDDLGQKTLFSLSTLDKELKQKVARAGNVKTAEFFGEVFARRAKEKGFAKVIFDRSGYLYHGRVKSFAENLRKGGLEF